MSLIKPGIHENMTLSPKTQINEHGTLELYIASVQDESAVLAALMENKVFQSMESNFRIYAPNVTNFDKKPKTAADIAGADRGTLDWAGVGWVGRPRGPEAVARGVDLLERSSSTDCMSIDP